MKKLTKDEKVRVRVAIRSAIAQAHKFAEFSGDPEWLEAVAILESAYSKIQY
jgi:hypothetical protein